eukprot:10109938-Ditylum_brightwellii.AAC.1
MDKDYTYVVPMKNDREVMLTSKQFAKEVRSLDTIICNHSQKLKCPKNFIRFAGRLAKRSACWRK